jgi:hypothetical protein
MLTLTSVISDSVQEAFVGVGVSRPLLLIIGRSEKYLPRAPEEMMSGHL